MNRNASEFVRIGFILRLGSIAMSRCIIIIHRIKVPHELNTLNG